MNTTNNILQELTGLNSSLKAVVTTPYVVPVGYFDGLAAQIINRVKALEAENALDEITILSPVISNISRQMPYQVPAGYFEDNIVNSHFVTHQNELSAAEELSSLSPLLGSINKQNLYSLPEGYFEQLTNIPIADEKPATKVVTMAGRKWWKMAAAAVVAGVLLTVGINFYTANKKADPIASVEKASDSELNDFLEITDTPTEMATVTVETSTKELLKDVSDDELKSFLQETSDEGVSEESLKLN
jgi:hypothetical protein